MAGSRISQKDLTDMLMVYKSCIAEFEEASIMIENETNKLLEAGDRAGLSGGGQAGFILDNLKSIAATFAVIAGKVDAINKYLDKKVAGAVEMAKDTAAASATADALSRTKRDVAHLAK